MSTTGTPSVFTGGDFVSVPTQDLEDEGVDFTGDVVFADPDGNALMLHHRYAPRTQS